MSATNSRPSWPNYEPPEIQLVRLQGAQEMLREAGITTANRVELLAQRLQAQDGRLIKIEDWQRDMIKEMAKVLVDAEPILIEWRKWQARKKLIKSILNWVIAVATIYGAVAGKEGIERLFGVLRALERIFGAG
jgi:hypothetical protein